MNKTFRNVLSIGLCAAIAAELPEKQKTTD